MCMGESHRGGRGCGSGRRVSMMLQLKQKVYPPSTLLAIQHKVFINLHPISARWLRHWASQEGYTHSHVAQTHTLARTEIDTHRKRTQFNESIVEPEKKKKTMEHFGFYPRVLPGLTVGAGVLFINKHPDWTSSVRSLNRPQHSRQLYSAELCRDVVCSQVAQDYHEEIWFQGISHYIFTVIGHGPNSVHFYKLTKFTIKRAADATKSDRSKVERERRVESALHCGVKKQKSQKLKLRVKLI